MQPEWRINIPRSSSSICTSSIVHCPFPYTEEQQNKKKMKFELELTIWIKTIGRIGNKRKIKLKECRAKIRKLRTKAKKKKNRKNLILWRQSFNQVIRIVWLATKLRQHNEKRKKRKEIIVCRSLHTDVSVSVSVSACLYHHSNTVQLNFDSGWSSFKCLRVESTKASE